MFQTIIEGKSVQSLNETGIRLVQQQRWHEAVSFFNESLSLDPYQPLIYYFLGNCHKIERDLKEACECFRQALALDPSFHPARWGLTISQIPEIYNSANQIKAARSLYDKALTELENIHASYDERAYSMSAQIAGFFHPFFLPYQGENDRLLQQRYGQLLHRVMAHKYPQWATALSMPEYKKGEKIRIGFICNFFGGHSVWKMPLHGWLRALDKNHFDVYGYMTPSNEEIPEQVAKDLLGHFTYNLPMESLCAKIREDNLHALIFPEIGMDPTTTRIASLRLAPIQCTSWGHPQTSGLPTIDYFLSSALMEPENGQEYYTESLVKLSNLSIYYTPNRFQSSALPWQELGIRENSIKYLCCQTLFKYLPQYDWVWPEIALRIPQAQFIFLGYPQKAVSCMQERLDRAFQNKGLQAKKYVVMLEPLSIEAFTSLLQCSDVFLDSIGWSGCNSSAEALEQHLPVVTLPGSSMRSRHSTALLQFIGVEDTIARSLENYIEIAIQLGQNKKWRSQISCKIASHLHRLYYDTKPVRDLENFIREQVIKATSHS